MKKDEITILIQFAKKVRNRRHAIGITQTELAELIDSHLNCIGRIERVESNPSLTTAIKIAEALGVHIWDLLP